MHDQCEIDPRQLLTGAYSNERMSDAIITVDKNMLNVSLNKCYFSCWFLLYLFLQLCPYIFLFIYIKQVTFQHFVNIGH